MVRRKARRILPLNDFPNASAPVHLLDMDDEFDPFNYVIVDADPSRPRFCITPTERWSNPIDLDVGHDDDGDVLFNINVALIRHSPAIPDTHYSNARPCTFAGGGSSGRLNCTTSYDH